MAPEAAPTVLALDVGTSSVRALLFDRDAKPVPEAFAKVPHRPTPHAGEGATYDPEVLLERIYGAIDVVAARSPEAFGRVAAVGVSTFWHSLVGIDGTGRTLTPLYLWVDMRSSGDAARLRERLGAEEVRQRTGCPLHAAYLPAKLAWLARTEPALFDRCARFVSLGELLAQRIHGDLVVSPACASGSGLVDLRRGGWDRPLLDALAIGPERLGEIAPADQRLKGLRPEFRARWPRLDAVPWTLALGDGLTSSLGTAGVGARRAGRVVAMVGTSSSARTFAEPAPPEPLPRGLWAYRFQPSRSLVGGSLGMGGNLIQWIVETFRIPHLVDAEAEIAWKMQRSDEVGAMQFLPFLAGERSLGWHDAARGVFANVTVGTTAVDFLRAALESVTFGLADVIETMAGNGEVIASGNAMIKSAVWIQILADVLGRRIVRSPWKEASGRGAAMDALVAAGVVSSMEEIPAQPVEPVEPNLARHAKYREARERARDLYRRTIV